MAQAKSVPDDVLPPSFEQVAFIALPLSSFRILGNEGAKRGLTIPQLIAQAVAAFLKQTEPKE